MLRYDTPQHIAGTGGFKPTPAKRRLAGGTPAVYYALVNGPALLFVHGDQIVGTVTFDITNGKIATVRGIAAPTRLAATRAGHPTHHPVVTQRRPRRGLRPVHPERTIVLRVTIFGANGPTGRLLTGQALAAGHQVTAVTRRPESFPLRHDRLDTVGADVLDQAAVEAAVAQRDAVLSTLGVPAGKEPISTYSRGAANIVRAMRRHRVRRLVVVSSSGVDPHPYSDGGLLFNRVLLPYVTRVLGKTLYDDMRRMETLIRASDLDWTIVRPSGLYHLPSVTDYILVEGHADGRFTSRVDLAASMLALLDTDRYLRRPVSVITTVDNPTLFQWIRSEALAKR